MSNNDYVQHQKQFQPLAPEAPKQVPAVSEIFGVFVAAQDDTPSVRAHLWLIHKRELMYAYKRARDNDVSPDEASRRLFENKL